MTAFSPKSNLELGGRNARLRRGSLGIAEARDLRVTGSRPGAYKLDGSLAEDTVRTWGEESIRIRHGWRPADRDIVRVDGENVVWGGAISPHFGHFLIESVSRLWPLLPGGELEGLPVVFTCRGEFPAYAREWLAAFGARLVELPERGAVRFTRMHVPEPAWRIGAWIAPEIRDIHLHARGGMSVEAGEDREVLWLSRTGLADRSRIPDGEEELERLIAQHVEVVHPETMTLAAQIGALESSRAVAGVIGSAFHALLMAERCPDCLYLCPPWDKETFPAQHRLLAGKATFAQALSSRTPKRWHRFPDSYRLTIPEAVQALGATVLPKLLDDVTLAGVVAPLAVKSDAVEAPRPGGRHNFLHRGALSISDARELLAVSSIAGAYEPDGAVAADTARAIFGRAKLPAWIWDEANRVPVEMPDQDLVETNEEEVVWGGSIPVMRRDLPAPFKNLVSPFGHFLIESVSRLWPLLPGGELEGLPVVFTCRGEFPAYAREWLAAFGARLVELPERGAVRFTRMHVPEPAWRIGAWIAPEIRDIHLHARGGMSVEAGEDREVLWLSRTGLADRSRIPDGEEELERLIAQHVEVVHPETMTLAAQIGALESSRAVAGVIGSAFHALLMAERCPDCLYLCPPWDKETFPAQHRLLAGKATFAQALTVATHTHRTREQGTAFPHRYNLQIPEALRALTSTVLPTLPQDPQLVA